MNVLIACEESQRSCIAFRERGFNAFSCDIQDCSGGHPEWHIKDDCLSLLDGDVTFWTQDNKTHYVDEWDLIIAHPPCTYLSTVGNAHLSPKLHTQEEINARLKKRYEAAEFFLQFFRSKCAHIAVENPVEYMNTHYRHADQIIDPYFFAKGEDDAENYQRKRTCFWLVGLPKLVRTNDLPAPKPKFIGKRGKNIYFVDAMSGCMGGG